MKIAGGIISLVCMVVLAIQSAALWAIGVHNGAGMASFGFAVAAGFLLGGAFAFRLPFVAACFLAISGWVANTGGTDTEFKYLHLWAAIQFILAVLLALASVIRRRKKQTN